MGIALKLKQENHMPSSKPERDKTAGNKPAEWQERKTHEERTPGIQKPAQHTENPKHKDR